MGTGSLEEVFEMIALNQEGYSRLDPELAQIIEKKGALRPFIPETTNMGLYRNIAEQSALRFMKSPFVQSTRAKLPHPDMETQDREIPTRDGLSITIRVYQPYRNLVERLPVVINAHGGGWCLGGLYTDQFVCELMCRGLGIIVVDVDYRRAPEHKFPVMFDDVYDVVKWVSVNAHSIGGDLKKGFVLSGISGGGNLTISCTYRARDDSLQPALTGSILMCTGLPSYTKNSRTGVVADLFPGKLPSWDHFESDAVSGRRVSQAYGDLADVDPYSTILTPLHAQVDHHQLPPTYYQIAGADAWRDSAFLYTSLLKNCGVPVKYDLYPGLPHIFWSFYPQVSASERWGQDLLNGVNWLLEKNQQITMASRL